MFSDLTIPNLPTCATKHRQGPERQLVHRFSAIRHAVIGYLAGSGVFGVALVACIMLDASPFVANHGLSYYGVTSRTILWYVVGMFAAAAGMMMMAIRLPADPPIRPVRPVLIVSALLIVGVAVTPYTATNWLIGQLHTYFATSLYLMEFGLAIWLAGIMAPTVINRLTSAFLVNTIITAYLSLHGVSRFEFAAQITFQVIFSLVLLHSLSQYVRRTILAVR